MEPDETTQPKPRRPWLAFLLSVFAPGLGHVYSGTLQRAIAAVVLLFVAIVPLMLLVRVPLSKSPTGLLVTIVLQLCLWLVIPLDGALVARRRRNIRLTRWNRSWVYVVFAVATVLLSVVLVPWLGRHFFFQTFRIPSGAMMDTILEGEWVLADMRSRRLTDLQREDIVVFKHPEKPDVLFMKRIAGLPGETLELRNGYLYVNDDRVEEHYVADEYRRRDPKRNFGPVHVPDGQYFVLGDCRNRSADSRFWGTVPRENLQGKAIRVYWSQDPSTGLIEWDRIGQPLESQELSRDQNR